MTQEKTHPPTKPFTPDPTKKSISRRSDPASDLPTDPIRHGTADQHGKAGSQSHKNESGRSESGSRSPKGGTSAQHVKTGSQSKKNK